MRESQVFHEAIKQENNLLVGISLYSSIWNQDILKTYSNRLIISYPYIRFYYFQEQINCDEQAIRSRNLCIEYRVIFSR